MFQTAIGIELTSAGLRLAEVRRSWKRLHVTYSGAIDGFFDLPEAKRVETLAALLKKVGAKRHSVFLSLPHENGIVRQVEFPAEAFSNIKSVMALQIEILSPWDPGEIYWSFVAEKPAKGAKLVTTTIIIPKQVLDPWIGFFKSTGFPLSGACLSTTAWAHAGSILHEEMRAPFIVLGADSRHVEGLLVQNGRLTTVTVDRQQEDVLVAVEMAKQRLFGLGRIGSPEKISLLCHNSLAETLNALPATGKPRVVVGEMAAALMGLKRSSFQTNLIPAALRYRRSRLQFAAVCTLVAIVSLLGVALLIREPYQNLKYLREIQTEIERISPSVKEVTRQETELSAITARYAALSRAVRDQDRNLEALRELAAVLPSSTWLMTYNYQAGTVTISGVSESAAAIQKALEESPVFRDVQFASPITREATGKDRFTIRAAIEPNQ